MNKVANVEGKGRDDLTLNILLIAENVIRKVSVNCSKSIRNLAEGVKNSFVKFRKMLQKYCENIESVDPQLKNNPDLVENLYNLEVCWEKGKEFLLDTKNYNRLIFFSQLIEILCEKYNELIDLIDTRDPTIFVSIPGLLILKCIEIEDQGICKEYNPNMFIESKECYKLYNELLVDYNKLKDKLDANSNLSEFKSIPPSRITSSINIYSNKTSNNNLSIITPIKNNNDKDNETEQLQHVNNSIIIPHSEKKKLRPRFDNFFLYNFLEKIILFEEDLPDVIKKNDGYEEFYDKTIIAKFLGKIKTLSMNLQREKPSEWNSFFDMAMNTISESG